MLLSLQSTNEDYSTIRTNIDIPWECKYVKYWISCVNFNANTYKLSNDDYIKYHTIDIKQYKYIIKSDYLATTPNANDIDRVFEEIKPDAGVNESIEFSRNASTKQTVLTTTWPSVFDDITPRARMVFGLQNLEVGKKYGVDVDGHIHRMEYTFDIPVLDYANKMYIISKQGSAVHANVGKQEYTPSILASIDTVIRDGLPVIVNFESYGKPIKNVVNIDSFKYMELQLVDYMFQPVLLMNPMFVTVKVKPCKAPYMRLTE